VSLTPVGNGAVGAVVSLDTSQGAADPSGSFAGGKLGVDKNNLYVYIGNATQFQVNVEYCQYSGPFPQA
jgi:predicted nucleic acid-binding Zn finger protein